MITTREGLTSNEESVRRNAFSLALWDGATDKQADAKAAAVVEDYRIRQLVESQKRPS
jgi:hypothetical protein